MRIIQKSISVLLVLAMVATVIIVKPAEKVEASVNHTRDEAVAWANAQIGNWLDYDGNGCECVDLIYYYVQYLGFSSLIGGNAIDYAYKSLPSGWSYQNSPQAGDIVVWDKGVNMGNYNYSQWQGNEYADSGFGHIGIVVEVRSTTIVTIETNTYSGYVGGGRNASSRERTKSSAKVYIRPDWPSSDTTSPVVKDVVVSNVTSSGYTVSCTVTDSGGSGLNRVEFPTWTFYNDQDDLKTPWPQGTSSGSRYTYTVKISEHNYERGPYATHIYGWDNAGNKYCYKLRVLVPTTYPSTISKVDYSIYNNHLYVLYDYYLDWATAESFCVSKGGHLASVTSSTENQTIYSLLQKGTRKAYYIGGYDYGKEGTFVFTDGSTMTYKNWKTGEPNNDNSENYMNMYQENGYWNDTRGYSYEGEDRCGFVLELDLNSITKQQVYDRFGIDLFTDISSVTISSIADRSYTGSAIEPEITVTSGTKTLVKGTDYTVSYSNNTNIGTATVTVTGIGDYKGTKTATFQIVADTSDLTISDIDAQSYTGTAIEPEITVTCGTKTLVQDTDYTVEYSDNINVGTATVTVTGIGNYTGTGSKTFEITAKSLDGVDIGSIADKTYTGSAIKPSVTVKDGTKTLKVMTDYTLSYSSNKAVGTATVTITGKGNYTGTRTTTFQIVPKAADLTISEIDDQSYTGAAIEPEITVTCGTKTLVQDTDYTIEYSDNTNAGTATVTVTGIGNYSGTGSTTFEITAKSIAGVKISSIADKTYTGSEIKPSVTVKDGTKTLTKDTDYTVKYSNNINAGTAKVTVSGIGNYQGTKTATFQIVPKATALTITDIDDQSYTGTAIEPDITVTCGTKTLVQDTDYTVEYSDNINVGTATVTVTGIGNYSGTGSTTFEITAKSLDNVKIGSISDKTYTGSVINPSVTVKDGTKTLKADTDYTLSYSNNTAVGTAIVTVTGKGNYSGTRTTTFNIVAANASDFVVSDIADQDYTGSAITPDVTVKFGSKTMVKDKDYVIVYSDNTNPGTATITIVGTGNFTGTKVVTFNIVGKAPEPQPAAKFTWKKSSGKWYYVDQNGNKTTGFATIDGSVYYFNSKGIMLTGWQQVDGVWYYFASSGVMKTGWQKISKKWYYFNDAGMMLTGVQTIAGKTYGFDTSGKMLTGWQKLDGIWYYFLSGGEAATGWKKISKKWYWFYSDGSMASSETIRIGNKDYKFNSSGVCTNP